jgi:quercetin dioxygenase-like cupin family protein
MALDDTVTTMNLIDMIEFDQSSRLVRKKMIQSELIVSEIACYEPGQFTKTHVHPNQDEIFYCVEGTGAISFTEREDVPIKPGSIVFIPKGVEHGVDTNGDSRLVIMFTKGPGLPNPRPKKD